MDLHETHRPDPTTARHTAGPTTAAQPVSASTPAAATTLGTTAATHRATDPAPPPDPRPPRHVRVVPALAAVWWGVAALVALTVTLLGRTLPVGDASRDAVGTLLHDVPGTTLSPLVTLLALVGATLAVVMLRTRRSAVAARGRAAATVVAAVTVAGAVALTDASILARLGYLPLLVVRAPFDAQFRDAFAGYVTPGVVLQYLALGGAILLTWATVLFARRARGACEVCGRTLDHPEPAWRTPTRAAVWGRRWAVVAAVIPALYAATRLAWVAGYPFGMQPDDYDAMVADGMLAAAFGLAAFALVGSVLTLGLFQRWGEVFPRWMVGLAGRRVPIMLAVVPATLVAAAVVPASLTLLAIGPEQLRAEADENWGALAPMLLWPLWGPALGAATYAYYLRRRPACRTCGLG
ncbi:hypothetical protein [Cellulomonas cellasea]|uniref:Uncharacterized protein n=2 Tax=Cellulomonas cellasea TaxID=43670 RepID=A0A0A0B5L8_9CELL|nr:hypothetical protein [Cellulomonas cellasea]KGM01119.1 hypothetical protein Q760_03680 [Cellulomonas cellasea DSM 20118]GEA87553.1 hypothetical protein CCE01nite_15020 [Cellulomonas cellasea]